VLRWILHDLLGTVVQQCLLPLCVDYTANVCALAYADARYVRTVTYR